jgi:hypothetical protein
VIGIRQSIGCRKSGRNEASKALLERNRGRAGCIELDAPSVNRAD